MQNFAELIAPLSLEAFQSTYHDKKPLHVKAKDRKRFSHIMSWEKLNALISMTSIWSPQSLQLILNKAPIHPTQYCDLQTDRNLQETYRPDPLKVTQLLEKGSSLICNDIDQLSQSLSDMATILESQFHAKCQGNLYCSWEGYQAFDSHFDTHDVYALHMEGTKTWQIYEGRVNNPIPHPYFKNLSQSYHEQHKGNVMMEAHMEPGDLLYIPRGYYHDAIATSKTKHFGQGSIHIAFGVNHMIGLDIFDILREYALQNDFFRQNTQTLSSQSIANYMQDFVKNIEHTLTDIEFQQSIQKFQQHYAPKRSTYNLPVQVKEKTFILTSDKFQLIPTKGQYILSGPGGKIPLPPQYKEVMSWILEKKQFEHQTYINAFSKNNKKSLDKLLTDLRNMNILKEVS